MPLVQGFRLARPGPPWPPVAAADARGDVTPAGEDPPTAELLDVPSTSFSESGATESASRGRAGSPV